MNPVVERMLKDIEEYLSRIEKYRVGSATELSKNQERFDALSMVALSLISRVLDLGEEVIRSHNMGYPGTYREIIDILMSRKVLNHRLAKEMIDIVKYRNKFAHEYSIITLDDLLELQTKTGVVIRFVKALKKLL